MTMGLAVNRSRSDTFVLTFASPRRLLTRAQAGWGYPRAGCHPGGPQEVPHGWLQP